MRIKSFIFLLNVAIVLILSCFLYFIYINQQKKMVSVITDNIRKDLLDSSYIATKFLNESSKIYNLRPLFDRKVAKNLLIKGFVLEKDNKILFISGDANLKIPKKEDIQTDIKHITLKDLLKKDAYSIPIYYYIQDKKYKNNLYVFLDKERLKELFQNLKIKYLILYFVIIGVIFVFLNYIIQVFLINPLIKIKEFAKRNSKKPENIKIIELNEIKEALYESFQKLDSIINSLYKSSITDYLTKLGNRKLLEREVKKLINQNKRFSVVFIDLDNFKEINDYFGHSVGDELIVKVANDLRKITKDDELLVRIGGDEFVMVLNDTDDAKLKKRVEEILNVLKQKRVIKRHELITTASLGVAIYPDAGESFDEILKNADIAMYEAKYKGKNKYVIFDNKIMQKIKKELNLKNRLSNALQNNEFFLTYQPKVDKNEKIIGCEALIRWNCDGEIIYPEEFIHLAEKNGLIYEIGKWVIIEVLRQLKTWQKDECLKDLTIAFNVSVAQIRNERFIKDLVKLTSKFEANTNKLEMEITESIFIENKKRALKIVRAIKHMGFRVSLDDFGTGYSSFLALKDLDIDDLKIDKSFIDEVEDEKGKVYTKTIVEMAKNLGMKTIAEGVERKTQFEILKSFNVDYYQGFYFAKPMKAKEFEEFVKLKAS